MTLQTFDLRPALRGPLAHLVERFHGMEEVIGSSPIGSTTELSSVSRIKNEAVLRQTGPRNRAKLDQQNPSA